MVIVMRQRIAPFRAGDIVGPGGAGAQRFGFQHRCGEVKTRLTIARRDWRARAAGREKDPGKNRGLSRVRGSELGRRYML
jgi:hypothetical protein